MVWRGMPKDKQRVAGKVGATLHGWHNEQHNTYLTATRVLEVSDGAELGEDGTPGVETALQQTKKE